MLSKRVVMHPSSEITRRTVNAPQLKLDLVDRDIGIKQNGEWRCDVHYDRIV